MLIVSSICKAKASELSGAPVFIFFRPALEKALWDVYKEMEREAGNLSYDCTITFI